MAGRVEAIYVRPSRNAGPISLDRVRAGAGRGLEGDRYFAGTGTYSEEGRTGQDLTLIEAEALDALVAETGIALPPAESRRNVVTRGIGLNDLVGKRFRVGPVVCYGQRLCEPCAHLESLTQDGVLRGLVHGGGLRADILTDGEIALGDPVESL